MEVGEPQRIWESEPLDDPALIPEDPRPEPLEPKREPEPVPAP